MDSGAAPHSQLDMVVKRSWDKRGLKLLGKNWPYVLGSALAAIAFGISAGARSSALTNLIWVGGTVAGIALLVAVQEQGTLFVEGDRFGERKWPLPRRSFPIAEVGSVRRVTRRGGGQPPWPHIVVLDRNGRRLLDILAIAWADHDLDLFIIRLGLPLQGSFNQVVSGREFNELFPRR